jgi:hypothetical protein
VDFLKRTDAGKRTVTAFGRRWVRNFFKNLGNIQHTLLYRKTDIPVIITGSGPGLEKALPVIQKSSKESLVLAASSSVLALVNYGITPDLIITADGSSWALRHIYPFFRTAANSALAANLCAALPSQFAGLPVLLINDGSFWQNIVFHELALPSVLIAQKGTVTATAAELALQLSGGNIFLAGTDLSVQDIRTHVRPYSFDQLLFDSASRFTPVYSQSFIRSGLLKDGGSFEIYAAWFKNALASWPRRIFSLTESSVFENKERLPEENNRGSKKGGFFEASRAESGTFTKRAAFALAAALKNGEYSSKLISELSPMLFPDKKDVTASELEKEIFNIAALESALAANG